MNQETMSYKGYTALVQWDEEENAYTGDVADIGDILFFRSPTLVEAHKAFEDVIDYYLKDCDRHGHDPCRPNVSAMAHSV